MGKKESEVCVVEAGSDILYVIHVNFDELLSVIS